MPTQSTDIIVNGQFAAIFYGSSGLTWRIAKGVTVSNDPAQADGAGVYSGYNDSVLINRGDIKATGSSVYGVVFAATDNFQNGTIVNKGSGTIVGPGGAFVGGTTSKNLTIENHGLIDGTDNFGVFSDDVAKLRITNTGKIHGAEVAVAVTYETPGLASNVKIVNEGKIVSPVVGIQIDTPQPATIINDKGGVIKGTNPAILSSQESGGVSIVNKGTIKGEIVLKGLDAKDSVVNQGTIKGDVYLENGNDTYKNDGGKAGWVHSGFGNDKLIAGNSKDVFVFDTSPDGAMNVDRVKHFESGKDKFVIKNDFFNALTAPGVPGQSAPLKHSEFHIGKHAHDTDDHIIYHQKSGELYYDSNGSDSGGMVQIAQLDPGQVLKASDFIVLA
jgi:Ca2+-binding RTX toxin-like protein